VLSAASTQGFRDWWVIYRSYQSRRYREFMDELIATTPVDPNYMFLGLACDTPVGDDYWEDQFVVDDYSCPLSPQAAPHNNDAARPLLVKADAQNCVIGKFTGAWPVSTTKYENVYTGNIQ
jgi:hypothetical protein